MRESKQQQKKTFRFGQVSGEFGYEIETEYSTLYLITFKSSIYCRIYKSSNESW